MTDTTLTISEYRHTVHTHAPKTSAERFQPLAAGSTDLALQRCDLESADAAGKARRRLMPPLPTKVD